MSINTINNISDKLGTILKAPQQQDHNKYDNNWSFTENGDEETQSLGTTVSDDCSRSSYYRLCDDVEESLKDLVAGVDDLNDWKDNIISLVDLPKNILTGLMVAVSKLCRVKSTMRILLGDVGLVHLTRSLASGVLQHSEIKRLKNLSVQCRSQLDVEEMRTIETERKLRASLAQTICLRSQNRITRWYILTQKLVGRERKRSYVRKAKTLREHTTLLKKMLTHANNKIRKITNKQLSNGTSKLDTSSSSLSTMRSRSLISKANMKKSTKKGTNKKHTTVEDDDDDDMLEHREQYGYEEMMSYQNRMKVKIEAQKKNHQVELNELHLRIEELKAKMTSLLLVSSSNSSNSSTNSSNSNSNNTNSSNTNTNIKMKKKETDNVKIIKNVIDDTQQQEEQEHSITQEQEQQEEEQQEDIIIKPKQNKKRRTRTRRPSSSKNRSSNHKNPLNKRLNNKYSHETKTNFKFANTEREEHEALVIQQTLRNNQRQPHAIPVPRSLLIRSQPSSDEQLSSNPYIGLPASAGGFFPSTAMERSRLLSRGSSREAYNNTSVGSRVSVSRGSMGSRRAIRTSTAPLPFGFSTNNGNHTGTYSTFNFSNKLY